MRASRRGVLKGAGATAALGLPGAARAALPALVVFDSRLPESASFAASLAGPKLDLARAHDSRWAELRCELPALVTIEGLTGWSDWVAVRGELESRGLRLVAERPVKAALSGRTHLFRWTMKPR